MDQEKPSFDWGMVFSVLACFCLGVGLLLFIRNNELLANGASNLWRVDAIVMLGVLGIPFVLMLVHLIRAFTISRNQQS